MPDYSFIANPQTGSGLQSLSSIMNTASTAQQMRMNALNIQQKQQTLPSDVARVQAESRVVQGTEQPRIQQAQAEAKRSQFSLSSEQAAKALQIAGGYAQDPRIANSDPEGTIGAATEIRSNLKAIGVPDSTAEFWASQVASRAHQPGAALQFLRNAIQGAAGSGVQAGVQNAPVTMQTLPSGGQAPLQLQPGAPGAVQPVPISSLQGGGVIPAGIPPGQLQQPTTDVLGNPVIAEKDQQGGISFKAPPGTNYKPMMQFPPGENAQTLPEVQAIRTTANALAAAAPEAHYNNQQILKLAPEAFTGTGSGQLAKLANLFGGTLDPGQGEAYVQLQHFIARATVNDAAAQGANTDQARSVIAAAVQPKDSPETATKNIAKVNDAYVTGKELYNTGLEAAINNPSNQTGVFAARQFRNAWAASFDPRVTLLENAQKTGDKETINRILGTGPQREAVIKDLIQKTRALQALSQGHM